MSNDKGIYQRLGANIKALRLSVSETQEELAYAIGESGGTTIANYEKGFVPQRDALIRLAKHFMITEHELLYGDYTHIKKGSRITNYELNNKQMLLHVLPIVSSEEALDNANFFVAYTAHLSLLEDICNSGNVDNESIDKCILAYKEAEAEGVLDATANRLWWVMFYGWSISMLTPGLIDNIDLIKGERVKTKDILKRYILPSFDDEVIDSSQDETSEMLEEMRLEFAEASDEIIINAITKLKSTSTHSDIGDYYLATRYLLHIAKNTLSAEINRTLGKGMLEAFNKVGNKYAKKYLDFFDDF